MAEEKRMDKIVSLCKRRGFLFQGSEIYGGLNGFWDYGPLGVELKRNVKEAWWREMVTAHNDLATLPGAPVPYQMVGLDCAIIMHPQVWKCSGHYDLFVDKKVDCRACKARFRADHIGVVEVDINPFMQLGEEGRRSFVFSGLGSPQEVQALHQKRIDKLIKALRKEEVFINHGRFLDLLPAARDKVECPECGQVATLTEPRDFNLMFKTIIGALGSEEDAAFLRPETAQGIFVNFKNVVDTARVKIPFGIAQTGKSFRNEITPRNFTFRSREFEQMEIEFFCHPSQSLHWYRYWRDRRYKWYVGLGLAGERLRMREHSRDELSHYSCGTADIEYAFPFLEVGEFGELEGVAHRGDFDLRSHQEGKLVHQDQKDPNSPLVVEMGPDRKPKYPGSGKDLKYFDDQTRERYWPHVIEPSAGADRATLAFLCEAYTEDNVPDADGKPRERVFLKLHPRLAPFKAAVFPLVNKDGMPEVAQTLYLSLKTKFNIYYDDKGAVGRRYSRQDEAGTPFCITIDGDTLRDQTVTIRERDTLKQRRIALDAVADELHKLLESAI
jgi:glycyl-tRNA synthetase